MDYLLVISLARKTMKRMDTLFWNWQTKTVKLTNSNYLENNGETAFLLKPVSSLHTTEFIKCLFNLPFYFNKEEKGHALEGSVWFCWFKPSFLIKLPNMSENYMKFIPVETVVLGRVTCFCQITIQRHGRQGSQGIEAGVPLAAWTSLLEG